jgi:hypothetical protein
MQLGVLMAMTGCSNFFHLEHVAAQGANSVLNPAAKLTAVRIAALVHLALRLQQRCYPVQGCCFSSFNVFHGTIFGGINHIRRSSGSEVERDDPHAP